MTTERPWPRILGALGGFLLLMGATIFAMEGAWGFGVFINLEALAIVLGGTFLLVWAAYPLKTMLGLRDPRMLAYAADSAVSMGALGTLFGFILMLSSITDLEEMPRRVALSLDAAFFGVLLSRFVLRPLAERAKPPGT